MIKYRLHCTDGHEFEAWFKSSAAYEAQEKSGHVVCPECGSTHVTRSIMAPSVATSRSRERTSQADPAPPADTALAAERPVTAKFPTEVMRVMRELRREVEAKAEYVGPRFAEEARKIHHDESPARGIYGEASLTEAKELADEGIPFLPLPKLPEDEN